MMASEKLLAGTGGKESLSYVQTLATMTYTRSPFFLNKNTWKPFPFCVTLHWTSSNIILSQSSFCPLLDGFDFVFIFPTLYIVCCSFVLFQHCCKWIKHIYKLISPSQTTLNHPSGNPMAPIRTLKQLKILSHTAPFSPAWFQVVVILLRQPEYILFSIQKYPKSII